MGCDIHLVVERKRDDGSWERVLPPVEARDPWLVEQAAKQPDDRWYQVHAERTWYDDRNYDLFGVLANVRNGTWGDPVTPISEPRGLPDDLSPEVRALVERLDDEDGDSIAANDVGLGDHSHSWLTLAELLAYKWDTAVEMQAVMDAQTYAAYAASGKAKRPERYSAGVGGGNVIVLTEAEADAELASTNGIVESRYRHVYVIVTWRESVRDRAGVFLTRTVPALQGLGDPERVRIVFGFDS